MLGIFHMVQIRHEAIYKMKGISLLEVMLIIGIMSFISSVGIYHWHEYQQRLKLDIVSAQLMTFLAKVQLAANWSNGSYQLQTYIHDSYVKLKVIDHTTQETIARFNFTSSEKSVTLQEFDLLSPVIFYGRRNMASPGHFVVSNEYGKIKIIISARGRVRRCTDAEKSQNKSVMGIVLC